MGQRLTDNDADARGLFNYCGAQVMSWHGLAAMLLDAACAAGMDWPALQAVGNDQSPTAARRTRNSVLDCAKGERQCGLAPVAIDRKLKCVARAIPSR